jgi:hypothetical protein
MSDAELYSLSSDLDEYNEDADLFDGCDPIDADVDGWE